MIYISKYKHIVYLNKTISNEDEGYIIWIQEISTDGIPKQTGYFNIDTYNKHRSIGTYNMKGKMRKYRKDWLEKEELK